MVFFQLRQQHVVEDGVLTIHLGVHQLADARQGLVRLQTVGTGLFTGEVDLLLQAGDADLEELVEVAGEDQQEFQALEQRVALVQRLLQHPNVELQLRQLAMNVQAAVVQARDGDGRRGGSMHGRGGCGLYCRLRGLWQIRRGLHHLFGDCLSVLDRDRG
ncbi:hypothetical protein D3C81_1500040 [compost metagenome]